MSDSSLVPERQLVFSPGLAATIGLEEAIFLQHLQALFEHREPQLRDGYAWLSVDRDYLLRTLPFWSAVDLHRISRSLTDKGVILMDSPPLHSAQQMLFALNEKVRGDAVQSPTITPPPAIQPSGASLLSSNWSPSEDMLHSLSLSQGITRQFALDQLEDFVLYWRERNEVSHAWEHKFRQHITSNWRRQQQHQAEAFRVPEATTLERSWQPSADAMEILARSEINPDFVSDAIPEFVLYWRERGATPKELNSKFIQHIRIQWKKYTSSLEHSTEPKRISEHWHPSADAFDILALSHIDADYAKTLIAEFIMYWHDSNQMHTSWNTKYLQHVKYHWAKRHKMEPTGNTHAGRQGLNPTGRTRDRSLQDDLTDTSWAS